MEHLHILAQSQFVNMPTAAERSGDFSRSFDVNGKLIAVRDPQTGAPSPVTSLHQAGSTSWDRAF
jgi:hypothetical protein